MSSFIKVLVGLLLILAAIIGLLFSIGGMFGIWQVEPRINTSVGSTLDLLSASLGSTYDGMVVTQQSLKTSIDSVKNLEKTVGAIAITVSTTNPLLDSVATLVGDELPTTLLATQDSLNAASEGALVIDGMLQVMSAIPFISTKAYNPEVPLSTALGDLAGNLDGLPEKFVGMSDNLSKTNDSLVEVKVSMEEMAGGIGSIASSLEGYDAVVEQYKVTIQAVQKQMDLISKNLPTITTYLVWGVTIFLIWMAISQIGLLTQGIEWVQRGRKGPNIYKEEIDVDGEDEKQAEQ